MRPALARQRVVPTVLGVITLHVVLIALLNASGGWRTRLAAPPPPDARVNVRLILAPVVPPIAPSIAPARIDTPAPRRAQAAPGVAPEVESITPAAPITVSAPRAEPAASASDTPLLETDATRRAIRASARATSLTDQLAHSREEPARVSAQQRLGADIRDAGRGDCLKGEYLGAGAGLLSLPFLAAAAGLGHCAK